MSETTTPAKVRTLDEAIAYNQRAALLLARSDAVGAQNAQQMVEWLRELRVLRAALQMDPQTVTG